MWSDTAIERVFAIPDAKGAIRNICVWVDGREARMLDRLPQAQQIATVVDELTRLRPSTKGALEYVTTVSWGNDSFAKGAYSHLAPGQCTRFAHAMANSAGRLYFAGEDTAIVFSGMEGALESADRVVGEVIEVL